MLKLIYQYLKGVFKIEKVDLAIIGSGPIGLFAASFANLHGLKTVVIDSLPKVGGQPKMLYPLKKITDIPAYASITGIELINKLKDNLTNQTQIITNHKVKSVMQINNGFLIDEFIKAKCIIIATGAGSFKPKELPLKLDDAVKNRIHYYVSNPQFFSHQTIGVLGGGDSALDLALQLSENSNIKLIHRRNQFRGLESSIAKLKTLSNVKILTPYLPQNIELVNNQLKISLKQMGTHQIKNEIVDQVVVAYGFKASNHFLNKWGINLNGSHIAVDAAMKTNIDGIYAIGDAIDYPNRVPLIALGFGEAQIAVSAIMRRLFPKKTLTIHSTSL